MIIEDENMENNDNIQNNSEIKPLVEEKPIVEGVIPPMEETEIKTEEVKPEEVKPTGKKKGFIENLKERTHIFLKKLVIFVVGFLVGIVFMFSAPLLGIKNPFAFNSKKTITTDFIGAKIEEVAELTTLKYKYTQVGKIENSVPIGNTNFSVPLTKSLIIVKVPGEINIGFDFNKVKVIEVNHNDKIVKINMPEPEILSNEISTKNIEVLTEQKELFNQENVSNYNELLLKQKEAAAKEAKDNGGFDMAKKHAELIITKFILEVVDDSTYTVEFKY